jgi:hypothetical protein
VISPREALRVQLDGKMLDGMFGCFEHEHVARRVLTDLAYANSWTISLKTSDYRRVKNGVSDWDHSHSSGEEMPVCSFDRYVEFRDATMSRFRVNATFIAKLTNSPIGSVADQSKLGSAEFAVGDFCYYDGGEIGRITHVSLEGGKHSYRIDYCQGKDLLSGPRGGNGPVWREGFPKPVTETVDVLFVAAMKERYRMHALIKDLDQSKTNFKSLKHSIELIKP